MWFYHLVCNFVFKMLDKTLGEGNRWASIAKSAVAAEFLTVAERLTGNEEPCNSHTEEDRKSLECFFRGYIFFK